MEKKLKHIFIFIILIYITSCYSVRLRTTQGVYEPDPNNNCNCYYRNMKVNEIDTVIKIDPISKDFTLLIKDCESEGIVIVEYRNTLGGILLSGITFGRHRKVKIKYVCEKKSN